MTALQWAELVIFIMLSYYANYANRDPQETDMSLPECVGCIYTHPCSILLRFFCCVYSIWYAFNQVPFFWNAMSSMEKDTLLQFLLFCFYVVCALSIPTATVANIVCSLICFSEILKCFGSCYKATRDILENNHFSRALLQIKRNRASVKYISLKTFLKVKDVISVYCEPEYYTLFYRTHNRKEITLSCSPLTYFVILLFVVKQKKKKLKEQEKQDSKEKKKKAIRDDSELLEIFIEDLQKRKEENERKANQYFDQAKETFEQIKNNS